MGRTKTMKKINRKFVVDIERFMPASWSVKEMFEDKYEWDFGNDGLMILLSRIAACDDLDFQTAEDAEFEEEWEYGEEEEYIKKPAKKIKVKAVLSLLIEEMDE